MRTTHDHSLDICRWPSSYYNALFHQDETWPYYSSLRCSAVTIAGIDNFCYMKLIYHIERKQYSGLENRCFQKMLRGFKGKKKIGAPGRSLIVKFLLVSFVLLKYLLLTYYNSVGIQHVFYFLSNLQLLWDSLVVRLVSNHHIGLGDSSTLRPTYCEGCKAHNALETVTYKDFSIGPRFFDVGLCGCFLQFVTLYSLSHCK